MTDIDKNFLAYYTMFFGDVNNYSCLVPPVPSETYDCYYFTNNLEMFYILQNTRWIPIFESDIPINNDHIKDTMASKELRTCPHKFDILTKYQYLCRLDSKLFVYESKILEVIKKMENSGKVLAFTKHPYDYHSVWDEFHLCLEVPKYKEQESQYKQYIEQKLKEGFSEYIDNHFAGGFVITKKCEKTRQFGETYYKHILQCGIEDQISLDFVQQLYKDDILVLAFQETWKYFYD